MLKQSIVHNVSINSHAEGGKHSKKEEENKEGGVAIYVNHAKCLNNP